jgi:DNA mismatch endonuclease, patch repair protein
MDIVSQEKRSAMMRAVRSKDTAPELLVRKGLHARKLRFRLHAKNLPGRPDLVLPKWKAVVFVHGCFWHGHGCAYSKTPKKNRDFWAHKIMGNAARDRANKKALEAAGWRVLVLWTCELKKAGRHGLPELLDTLAANIRR